MTTWQPTPPERGPRKIAEILDRTSARLGGPSAATASTIFARWEELVGTDIAGHARPVSLHDRVLTLAVDQPAWGAQLRFMTSELLTRIAEVTGGSEVAEIRIRVAGERPPRRNPTDTPGEAPRRAPTDPPGRRRAKRS
jgi:predicted nucleic acid-binding Zn ribbon protein